MSRPLLSFALFAFVVLCLGPLLAMLPRVEGADLAALLDARTWNLLGRTIGLGLGTAGLALVFGLPFAWITVRCDVPGSGLLRALGVAPLFMPTLLMAMTWTMFVEWRGPAATAWILGLSYFPLVAVFAGRAFERIDGRIEDAARLAGGYRAQLRASVPLVLPAALAGAALAFAFAVNDFAVPDYVSSVGPKFNVYADEIFANWNDWKRPGSAVATALPLVALTVGSLLPVLRLRRRGALASISSGFTPPQRVRLGAWRWPALLFCLGVLTMSVFLPLAQLGYEAWGGVEGSKETLTGAFSNAFELGRDDLLRSLRFAVLAASAATLIGLVLGHAIERARARFLGKALEVAALLPIAAPATLFGIGAIVLWSRPGLAGIYGSEWMPPLLFTGRLAAFSVLILSGAVASIDVRLEEAAALSGARPARRLFGIVAPPLLGALAASWTLVFAFALRELDAGILVPEANRTVILRVFNGVHFARDEYVAALSLLLVFASVLPALLWTCLAPKRLEVLP